MKIFTVTVLFGSDQVKKFYANEVFTDEEITEYSKTFTFATKEERDAFIQGLEAGNGWLDLMYLKGEDLHPSLLPEPISEPANLLTSRNLILTNKSKILPELYSWAETFIGELDEEGEKTSEPYDTVYALAERLEKDELRNDDFEEIFFHIYQINYDEIRIQL